MTTTCHYYRTDEDYRHSKHAPVLQFRHMAHRLISQIILLKITLHDLNRPVFCSGTLSLCGWQTNVYPSFEILSSKSHSIVVWPGVHISVLSKRNIWEGVAILPRNLWVGQAESEKPSEDIITRELWGMGELSKWRLEESTRSPGSRDHCELSCGFQESDLEDNIYS